MGKSFNRAAHVAAWVLMAGAASIFLAFQVWAPTVVLWPAAVAVVPMAAVLFAVDRLRTAKWAIVYLAVSGLIVVFVTWSVVSQLDAARATDLLGYTYLTSAVALVGGIGFGRRSVLAWGTAGYLIAEGSAAVGLALAGVPWEFDLANGLAFSGLVLLIVLSGLTGLRGRRVESRLRRAAHDEIAAAVVSRIEQRASAILHDTVLNHLSTLSHTPDGRMPDDQRALIERDLELMRGTRLGETLDVPDASGLDAAGWSTHPIYEAIRDARTGGLDVDITGDPEAALSLAPLAAQTVALAVAQSLVNVSKHSGVVEAEVALHSTGTEVMIMIIDGGSGFDPEQVGSDRLGLRNSIRGRVESVGGTVQIWTGVGKGTSIVMNVPTMGSDDTGGALSARKAPDAVGETDADDRSVAERTS